MESRKQILHDCPEGTEEWVGDVLDGIENEVNAALGCLEGISGVGDLDRVGEALCILKDVSNDLY